MSLGFSRVGNITKKQKKQDCDCHGTLTIFRHHKKLSREVNVQAQGQLYAEDAINFPKSLSSSDPGSLLDVCSQITEHSGEGDVIIDASELTFIDPLGLAVLRATLDCQPREKCIHIRFLPKTMASYLTRMEFFQGLNVDGIDENDRNPNGEPDNCVELIQVLDQGQSEEIASRLIQAMTGLEHSAASDNPEQDACLRPIEYALKELLENALSHAKREGNQRASVWVACQHFRTSGKVRLAIVDNGCGFLATLRGHAELAENTDVAAIQAALVARVSCNRGPNLGFESESQNQGVGLTTTARIAAAADGHLVVISGNAWVHTERNDQFALEAGRWKGVAIAFTCSREKLPQVDIPSLLPHEDYVVDAEIQFD